MAEQAGSEVGRSRWVRVRLGRRGNAHCFSYRRRALRERTHADLHAHAWIHAGLARGPCRRLGPIPTALDRAVRVAPQRFEASGRARTRSSSGSRLAK